MGTITLADLKEDVKVKLGNRNDPKLDDNLVRWINSAYLHMAMPNVKQCRELRTSALITLVLDQSTYPLTEAVLGHRVLAMHNVYYADTTGAVTVATRKHNLRPRSTRVYDRSTQHNAQPRFFNLDEGLINEILIWPVPGATEAGKQIGIRYWRSPSRLVLDTDTSLFPEEYDEALSLGAIAFCMSHLPGYDEEALLAFQRYQAYVNNSLNFGEIEADDWGHRADVRVQEYTNISANAGW